MSFYNDVKYKQILKNFKNFDSNEKLLKIALFNPELNQKAPKTLLGHSKTAKITKIISGNIFYHEEDTLGIILSPISGL